MKYSSKSEMLHAVIHQMGRTEKRLFRLEINKLKKGSDYSLIFDYLLKITDYKEQKFRQYAAKHKITSLISSVDHLFAKLITFITVHRSHSVQHSKIRYKIEKMRSEAKVMYQLNLIVQAHKSWKRTLKLALENDEPDLAVYCFEFLNFIEERHKELKLSSTDLTDKTMEVNVREHTRLWAIQMELKILVQKSFKLFNDLNTTEEDWKFILENPIFSMDINTVNFSSKIIILDIKGQHYAWKYDFEQSIIVTKELLAVLREDNKNFIAHFPYYRGALYNLCYDLYNIKHPDLQKKVLDFEQSFGELKKLAPGKTATEMNTLSETHTIMNSTIQLHALLLRESFTLKDVNKWSLTQYVNLAPSNKFVVLAIHISAYLYLILKKQKKFIEFKNILVKCDAQLYDPIIEWELELLSLIDIYENEIDKHFQNQLKNTIRRSKKKDTVPEIITYMFYLLAELRKTAAPKKVLEAALLEIEVLEAKSKLINLYYSVWVRWRLKEYEINTK